MPRSGRSLLGPTVAGTWYPADAGALGAEVDALLAETGDAEGPAQTSAERIPVAALIAPHAGFAYSGRVAARGFRTVGRGPFGRVILLGPSHYAGFEGATLPCSTIYRTPLGEVPLDTAAVAQLRKRPGISMDDGPFRPEHCLEAEIPFLQRLLAPGWRLLPVLIGMIGRGAGGSTLAEAFRPLIGPDTLVVVSSDFTHYGPRFDYVPFDTDVPARIEQLDMGAVERILEWDLDGFETYLERTRATICGRNAIRVLLDLFPEGLRGWLAAYDTSGRITGEWDHSVSYASLAFGRPGRSGADG